MKILAIDDSPTLRHFITRSLNQHSAGYKVITANDGEQGIELADSELPSLILLDFVLPGLKGDDVCRHLAKSERTRGIPIVLMSSSTSDIQRTAAECSNVVKSISKPFTPELLCATVGGVVRTLAEKQTKVAPAAPAPEPVAGRPALPPPGSLRGHTGSFPLHSVLLAIEQDGLTGVLRIFTALEPIQLYVKKGRPILISTGRRPLPRAQPRAHLQVRARRAARHGLPRTPHHGRTRRSDARRGSRRLPHERHSATRAGMDATAHAL